LNTICGNRKPEAVWQVNISVQGATLRCQLSDQGQKYGISVTVTDIDAGDVNFDFKVDDQPS
jgi:hypothetical protein